MATQGLICATSLPGPELPAEAATNTPALAAPIMACATMPLTAVCDPPIEKLMTSTPSATALSMAATVSPL